MEKKYEIVLRDGKPICKTTKLSTKWTPARIEEILRDMIAWMNDPEHPHNIFQTEYLLTKGLYPNFISGKIRTWEKMEEKDRPDLTEIYHLCSMAKKTSEMKVLKGGLLKKYDPTIAKLTLSQHHGYKERIEQGANNNFYVQQNILNANLQNRSATEIARRYQQNVRNLPGSQSIPLPGAEEISADIE
jgi:hypothetical protein